MDPNPGVLLTGVIMWNWFKELTSKKNEVIVYGNEGSGKFSLFQAMRDGSFTGNFENPALDDFTMTLDNNEKILFRIDSTTFDKKTLPTQPDAVISIVDLSSDDALEDYLRLKQQASLHYGKSTSIIVGTKCDLIKERPADFTKDMIMTSAKTKEGIDLLEEALAKCFGDLKAAINKP